MLAGLVEETSGQVQNFTRFFLAVTQARTGQTDDAVTTFSQLRESESGTPLGSLAANQLAHLQLKQGNLDEALALWSEILDDEDTELPKDEILVDMAQATFTAGRRDEALQYYKRLKDEHPTSPGLSDAQRRIEFLEAQLDKPEAPAAEEESEADSGA